MLRLKELSLEKSSFGNLLVTFSLNALSRYTLLDAETSNNCSFQEFEYLKLQNTIFDSTYELFMNKQYKVE